MIRAQPHSSMQVHVERLKVQSIPWNRVLGYKQLRVYFNTAVLVVDVRCDDELTLPSSIGLGDVFPDGDGVDEDIDVVNHHFAEVFLIKHGESMDLADNFGF